MKIFLILSLIAIISSNNIKFFKNLKSKNDADVKIRNCASSSMFFQMDELKTEPTRVEKGDRLTTTIRAYSKGEYVIRNLHVSIRYNLKEIATEDVPYAAYVEPGELFEYEYEYEIPSDYEPGTWDIVLILQDSRFDDLTCTDTYFEFKE